MSRKRSASLQTSPQAKRQAIESGVENQVPYSTIEPNDEPSQPSSSPLPLPSLSSSRSLQRSSLRTPSPTVHIRKNCSGKVNPGSQSLRKNISNITEEDMASTAASEAPSAESNISIGPDMPRCQDQLRFRGVRDADQDDENVFPVDWKELQNMKRETRESPGPSPEEHKDYRRTVRDMTNEAGSMVLLVPKILKAAGVVW